MRELHDPPIVSLLSAIKGFMSGGLISLSIFTSWDPVARIVLFVLGFLFFVDSVMPVDRTFYAVTTAFFFIIGVIIGFFVSFSESAFVYLIIIFIIAVIVYIDKIRRMRNLGKIR